MTRIGSIATAAGIVLLAAVTWRTGHAQRAAPTGIAASVGKLEVTSEDLERRYRAAVEEFRRRSGTVVPDALAPVIRRQALEALIRANLLAQEAQRRGIPVSDAEAEEWVKRDPVFHPGGQFNARAFEAARVNSPAEFQRAIRTAKLEIGARRLQEQLQKQSVGSEAALHAAAERALSRSPIDVLALPRAEFAGDVPEPTEAEVVAEYHAHAEGLVQPARAVLSAVAVPGAANDPNARARADSALSSLRAGTRFEDVGAAFGGVRGDQVVLEGNFPGSWRVTERQGKALFRLRPGAVLEEPVATTQGWLLVRADQVMPAGPVPLASVARDVRQELRRQRRREHDERRMRAQYEAMREELTRPARRVRYVAIAPERMRAGEPTAQDLDRYYRGHQADYTRYDAGSGALLVRPLAEVRDEIRARWFGERRELLARALAERVETAWRRGARDRSAENEAGGARERGPVVAGAPLDTTEAGRVLGDTLATEPTAGAIGTVRAGGGFAVYHVTEVVPRFTPPFEQVLPELVARERDEANDRDVAAARAMFERDPSRFAVGTAVFYSRILVTPPEAINVPLTRAEVERYYREHFDRYAAAEQVRARHILVGLLGSGPDADRAARERAEQLLARARAGEDFAALAREHSDDVATRQDGGDLGFFARGTMLDEIERAAFAMRPGDMSEPIRTTEGYHLIRVIDHLPLQAEPLKLLYANVGWDAALEKAERIARRTADSLFQVVRTPKQARAAAHALGLQVESGQHLVGDRIGVAQTQAIFERLERLKPGEFYPGVEMIKGQGAVVQWVDSVGTPSLRTWDQASRHVLTVYRRDTGRRAVDAKRAELDSLLRAGWSADSIAALWGDWKRVPEYTRGAGLEGYGGSTELDSLVFGTARTPALEAGLLSGWVDLPDAAVRVRPGERGRPTPAQIAQRVESDRRLLVEYRMLDEFKAMRQRFPVRIHDEGLRDVALPPLPPAPVL